MKPVKFLQIMLFATAGVVAACSTPKLAQNAANDDVYNTTAKAKEVEIITPRPQQQQAQQNYTDEYYGTSNPYYDMDYSSRINRFYNGYSWNSYYDPYFNNYYSNGYYGNNFYNNNYLGYGLSWYNGYGIGLGFGNYYGSVWNNPFYYGGGFYNGWGAYSVYDRYGYGGGYYGGGYYGGGYGNGGRNYTNANNRPRPNSNDTGVPRANTAPNYGRPSRSATANGNNGNNGSVGRGSVNTPVYTNPEPTYRPSRTETPTYSPPANNGGGSGGGNNGGSSGGGGGRPSRAGRG